jgi:hypothetical protein
MREHSTARRISPGPHIGECQRSRASHLVVSSRGFGNKLAKTFLAGAYATILLN